MKNSTQILQNIHHTQLEIQEPPGEQEPQVLESLYDGSEPLPTTENPLLTRKISLPRKLSMSKM